ncbi:MAG: helix-turn-helix transcriptional regulator [Patescibacteria group bacterium]|jgi:transcriptional regulator with XRE-family HTH domain
MSTPINILANNIKKLRKNKGISQDKLSKLTGVTLHAITKIEIGATLDPRVNTVKKIADALGCGVDKLLSK